MLSMNKIVFYILLGIILSSCSYPKITAIQVSASHDASEPGKNNFIQFKDSSELILPNRTDLADSQTYVSLGEVRKISIGKESFKANTVNAFQINSVYYKVINQSYPLGYAAFAKRIYRGPFNIYSHISVSTTTNRSGFTHANFYESYYLEKPDVQNGKLVLAITKKTNNLEAYLKDYQPSLALLKKYNEVRRKATRDKLIVLGTWLASIPFMHSSNQNVSLLATSNIVFGLIYVPAYVFGHKMNIRDLQFKAIQTYIDNNFSKSAITPLEKKAIDTFASNALVNEEHPVVDSTKLDFVVLQKGKKIVANEGTTLETANFQNFKINNQIVKENVIALQQKEIFYKQVYNTPDFKDYAYRYIQGKINVYENNWNFFSKKLKVPNAFYSRNNHFPGTNIEASNSHLKQSFFENNNNYQLVSNTMKMGSFFNNNAIAKEKYALYQKHVQMHKITNFSIMALSLLGDFLAIKSINKLNNTNDVEGTNDSKINLAVGFLMVNTLAVNFYILPRTKDKDHLNKELLNIVDYYNTH